MAKALSKTTTSGKERHWDSDSDDADMSKGEIFKVLSNQRRRWILQYLKDQRDDPVSLRHLVDHVTARENGVPVNQIDSTNRKNVYTALKQSHLPKMQENGIIEYDQQRGRIELTDGAHYAEKYLEYVPKRAIPWAKYYLAVSTVAATMTLLNVAGLYPFDGLSWATLTFILVGLFGLASIVHSIQQRETDQSTFESD